MSCHRERSRGLGYNQLPYRYSHLHVSPMSALDQLKSVIVPYDGSPKPSLELTRHDSLLYDGSPKPSPELARHDPLPYDGSPKPSPELTRYNSLPDPDCNRVFAGTFAKRLRVFADSGMGKTLLLIYCQLQIAALQSGFLPVRLRGLSRKRWRDDRFFAEIVADLEQPAPLLSDPHEADRAMWIERL